jgi:serine/threonine-protein kinase
MNTERELLATLRAWRDGLIDADQLRAACTAAEAVLPPGDDSPGNFTPPPPAGRTPEGDRGQQLLQQAMPSERRPHPRYDRIRLHATGGIGRVWLARDSNLGRDVALKELRPETAADAAIASRFIEEAQITGQLEHPGIIPIYELSQDPANRPAFYTMRFVKGQTLAEATAAYHARRRQGTEQPLDLRNLLGVFVSVCNAVAYAHSRGVIHRDLKGLNVLLGDFGEVMVLDWGLAKRLGQRAEAAPLIASSPLSPVFGGEGPGVRGHDTVRQPGAAPAAPGIDSGLTQPGDVLGTPAYMAPEQATGRLDQLDARTDVFALGGMLYEILTGQPPYQGANSDETLHQARTGNITAPRLLAPHTPPALEAICMKALRPAPADRYASAGMLAQDIQRWLADEPVAAYPEPLTKRIARWGRKHRSVVIGSAAVLLVAVVALTVGAVLINQQRAEAEANFQLAREAVDGFYTKVSEERLLNEPGLQPLREDLLRMGRDFYDKMRQRRGDDPAVQADRARATLLLGRIVEQKGDFHEGMKLMGEAEAVFARLHQQQPGVAAYRAGLAQTKLDEGVACSRQGEHAAAVDCWRAALPHFEQLVQSEPRVVVHRSKLALCRNNLGLTLARHLGKTEGRTIVEAAIVDQKELVQLQPNVGVYWRDLAGFRMNLANLLHETMDNADEARRLLHVALLDIRTAGELLPNSPEIKNDLAAIHRSLGLAEAKLDSFKAVWAEWNLGQAIRIREGVARANPVVTGFAVDLAESYMVRGNYYWQRGEFAQAESDFQSGIDLLLPLRQKHAGHVGFARSLGRLYVNQASARFADPKRRREAMQPYDLALPHLQFALDSNRKDPLTRSMLATLHWGKGVLQTDRGEYAAALAEWDSALEFAPPERQDAFRIGKGQTLARKGDHAAATELFATFISDIRKLPKAEVFELARGMTLALAAAAADSTLPQPQRDARMAEYAFGAIQLLEYLDGAGFFAKDANARKTLLEGGDFAPLRVRPEFREWLKGKGVRGRDLTPQPPSQRGKGEPLLPSPRRGEGSGVRGHYCPPTFTSILRGRTFSALGSVSRSTPLVNSATIPSGSTSSLRMNER